MKTLSTTRWSAHYDAIKALNIAYSSILNTLKRISANEAEKPDCRNEARSLYNKLVKKENAMLCILWEQILERFNKVSVKLQDPHLNLQEGYNLVNSLFLYLKEIKNDTESKVSEIGAKAMKLSDDIESTHSDSCARKRTKLLSNREKEDNYLQEKRSLR